MNSHISSWLNRWDPTCCRIFSTIARALVVSGETVELIVVIVEPVEPEVETVEPEVETVEPEVETVEPEVVTVELGVSMERTMEGMWGVTSRNSRFFSAICSAARFSFSKIPADFELGVSSISVMSDFPRDEGVSLINGFT